MKHLAGKWWWRSCVLAALAANAGAAGEIDAAWDPAVAQLTRDLDELARWCNERRLFARRDLTYEALLRFAPEHPDARRFLHHQRRRDGSFVPPARPHRAKDRSDEHLAEYEARRADVLARFRAPLIALAAAPGAEAAELERLWTTLLALDPEDERAHSARGEVRDEVSGDWVLRETATARRRTSDLAQSLAALLEEVGDPAPGAPTAAEEALGLRWTVVRTTEHVRVLGTCDETSIAECARAAEVALRLFAASCGADARLPSDYVIYVLATEAQRTEFLSRHPRLDAARRAQAERCSSYWIGDSTELAIFPAPPEQRLDHAVRQSIALMSVRHYALGPEEGWAFEGLGIYLTEAIAGRSLSHYGRGTAAADRSRAPARKPAVDERDASAPSAASTPGGALRLEHLLGKSAEALDDEERRICAGLLRYLVEGRPSEVDRALGLAGHDRTGAEALERALGLPVRELEVRVERFLREAAPAEAEPTHARSSGF